MTWISWGLYFPLRAPMTSGIKDLSLPCWFQMKHYYFIAFKRAPTDFDISAHLNIPILEAAPQIDLKVSYTQGTVAGQSLSLSGSLGVKNNEIFTIKFVRTDAGEFDLTAATPIPQVSFCYKFTRSGDWPSQNE